MKITLISVGKLKSGPERQLCERYAERFQGICRSCGISEFRQVELSESNQRRPADRMADESRAIAAAMAADTRLILLDERGKTPTSDEFAEMVRGLRAQGTPHLTFVIGGPDGLDPALRARGETVLSFGRLTMPHQLVRALLCEQLYRAATILTGHPYHRN